MIKFPKANLVLCKGQPVGKIIRHRPPRADGYVRVVSVLNRRHPPEADETIRIEEVPIGRDVLRG